jgi:hypothetical protein
VFDAVFNGVCRVFVNMCDQVIAVSKTTRNNVVLRTGVKVENVKVIPNGVSDVSHVKTKILAKKR